MKGLEPLDLSSILFLKEFDLLYNMKGLTKGDLDKMDAMTVIKYHEVLKTQREIEKAKADSNRNKGSQPGAISRIR